MERKWYYAAGGVRQGPVTVEELRVLVETGTLRESDLVWQPEFGPEWRTVGQAKAFFQRTAAPAAPPAVKIREAPVQLLGVEGARPSSLDAASQAFSRMVALLFQPFDLARWFSMGFCAWLAYVEPPSGNFRGLGDSKPEAMKQQTDALMDKVSNLSDHPQVAVFLAVFILLFILLAFWMCALRSRGDFMFLQRWYQPDAPILSGWRDARSAGHNLFAWRIAFFLVSAFLFASVGALAYVAVLRPFLAAGKEWSRALTQPTVVCATVAVLLLVGVSLVAHLTKAFVVPVMYWHGVPASRAWRVVFELCNQYPFAVLSYLCVGVLFSIAASLAIVAFVMCTCCIGLIPLVLPYLNGVVLLPFTLFFRGYAVCFLNQWRPDLVPDAA